jgi:diadenosine tetraphosphatase ApaH/serine/threonine PP2A family protein phosphatase
MYEKIAWCMDRLDWSLSFVGHTHEAAIFCKMNGKPVSLTSPTVAIGPHLYLINVGSVGQPRDGDWRASFALWDTEKHCVELQRVEYPVKITQRKIAELDYPNYLSERLSQGE